MEQIRSAMHRIICLPVIVFVLTAAACDWARSKGQQLADKVIPRFDADQPDTWCNKARFKDFLAVELTSDVKNIYCFDDATGFDTDYMFAFNCDSSTARKIIEKHQLQRNQEPTDYAFVLQDDFEWWDKRKIEQLNLYSWSDGRTYFKYFWYDTTEQKAYYFDFDL